MNPSTDAAVVIYVAGNAPQAHLLAGALEEEGIAASISNEALQGGLGGLPPGFDTAPRVLVDPRDAPRARELALEFERRLRPAQGPSGGRMWNQFTIRGLLFLTACVAVYLAVDRATATISANGNLAAGAVLTLVLAAGYLAIRRKRRDSGER